MATVLLRYLLVIAILLGQPAATMPVAIAGSDLQDIAMHVHGHDTMDMNASAHEVQSVKHCNSTSGKCQHYGHCCVAAVSGDLQFYPQVCADKPQSRQVTMAETVLPLAYKPPRTLL